MRCRISGPLPYVWLGAITVFTIVGVPSVLLAAVRGGPDNPPLPFALFFVAIVGWFWFVALVWISYEVVLFPDGGLEFKSVLRRVRTSAGQVSSIGPAFGGWDMYTLVIKFDGGSARVMRSMSGFHSMLNELQALNPELRLRGL